MSVTTVEVMARALTQKARRRPSFDPDIYTKGRPWFRLQ